MKMWFPFSTLAAICVLLDVGDATLQDRELDLIFRDRSKTDWESLWHQEKYSRCRETLARHLYWACEKDIYRLTRRSKRLEERLQFPWIPQTMAKRFLLKRSGSSITNECCKSSGCTWEEYAEYCPTNKRKTAVFNSVV